MPTNALANLADIRQQVTWYLEQDQATADDFWTEDMINSWIKNEHDYQVLQVTRGYEHFFGTSKTADVVANQESYQLPDDCENLYFLEHRVAAGQNTWRKIVPITDSLEERQDYHITTGISILGAGSSVLRRAYIGRDNIVRYHLSGRDIILVPFFNDAMTAGLRLWYDSYPEDPDDDDWVPFSLDGTTSLLPKHHEILVVGAAIRGKKREEVPDQWGDLYAALQRSLIKAVERRQVQRRKHGASHEGLY